MPSRDEVLSKAISSSSRREILRLLNKSPKTVTNIANIMGISTSLASKHLSLLDYFGIVEAKLSPPEKYYSIKLKSISNLIKAYDKVLKDD
jgi:predicted transcriptional regulator